MQRPPHLSIPLSFQSPLPLRIHLLQKGRGGHCGGAEVGVGDRWRLDRHRLPRSRGLREHLNLAAAVAAAVEDGGKIVTA